MDSINEIISQAQLVPSHFQHSSDDPWPKQQCEHGTLIDNRDGEICFWQCSKCVQAANKKREDDEHRANETKRFYSLIKDGGLFGGPISFPEVPRRFAGKTIDSYEAKSKSQQELKKLAARYIKEFDKVKLNGTGMIMAGKPGTGKTHIAWSIVNELRNRKIPAALIQASAMTSSVKATYNKDSEYYDYQVITAYSLIDLLVIDEVGVQVQTDSEKRIFFDIINRRYENMMPTIIITNLTMQETAIYIGERVIDRMKEGGGVIFAMDWDSYRR